MIPMGSATYGYGYGTSYGFAGGESSHCARDMVTYNTHFHLFASLLLLEK